MIAPYQKLGFSANSSANALDATDARDLLSQTLTLLEETRVSYPNFFSTLTKQFDSRWRNDETLILSTTLEKIRS